jgi:hypothetical protein
MDRTVSYLTRYTKLLVCLMIAIACVWRANTYVDPMSPPSVVPTLMCTAFAMTITFTGFALCSRSDD